MIRIYFWTISPKSIPWAISRMALDRRILAKNSAISFWKLLGSGKGETFTPSDADPLRWGLIVSIDETALLDFEQSSLMRRWNERSLSAFAATLQPISSQGKWSRRTPFDADTDLGKTWEGPVAAITRARIKWRKNVIFWRSVPPVTLSLHHSPGLIAAIGIGEAPIGLQGTFSLWQNSAAIRDFAYKGAAHKEVIRATHREQWYAEELFARFAVTEQSGSL
ncbi:MAG: hypothetical protein KJS67_00840 [Actinomycetales bacterium]|nr:hypothetical protein [Actinomycetales bacterium]